MKHAGATVLIPLAAGALFVRDKWRNRARKVVPDGPRDGDAADERALPAGAARERSDRGAGATAGHESGSSEVVERRAPTAQLSSPDSSAARLRALRATYVKDIVLIVMALIVVALLRCWHYPDTWKVWDWAVLVMLPAYVVLEIARGHGAWPFCEVPGQQAVPVTAGGALFEEANGKADDMAEELVDSADSTAVNPIRMLPYSGQDLSGLWIRDRVRSDAMDAACDAMHIHGLLRHAIKIVKGLRLTLTRESFQIKVISIIPGLVTNESYSVDGEESMHRRRDQRSGKHHGSVQLTSRGVLLLVRWGDPHAGRGQDLFHLVSPDELHVETEMHVEERVVRYRAIYHRQH